MPAEYGFSKCIHGKFAKQFKAGTNIIVLAPDVAKIFPDSEAVNETLRFITQKLMSGYIKNILLIIVS